MESEEEEFDEDDFEEVPDDVQGTLENNEDDDLDMGKEEDSSLSDVDNNSEQKVMEFEQDQNFYARFSMHTDSIYSILFANDDLVISGSGDETIKIWRILPQNGNNDINSPNFRVELLVSLDDHKESIVEMKLKKQFSAQDSKFSDAALLATGSLDGTVIVYALKKDPNNADKIILDSHDDIRLLYKLEGPSSDIHFLDFSPDDNFLVAGSEDASIWIWDMNSGQCVSVLSGHEASVLVGQFTPNGKRVISGGSDHSLRLWSLNGQMVHSFSGHTWHDGPIVSLVFFEQVEGGLFASGAENGRIIVAKLDVKKVLCTFWQNNPSGLSSNAQKEVDNNDIHFSVEALDFCRDATNQSAGLLVTGGVDGMLNIFDWKISRLRHSIVSNTHKESVVKVKFVGESFMFLSCCGDGSLSLFDGRSGNIMKSVTRHNQMILDFDLRRALNNEWIVVTASDDNTCRFIQIGN